MSTALVGVLGEALTAGLELARRDPEAQRIAVAARVGPRDVRALGRAARQWARARRRDPGAADVYLLAVLRLCSPELLDAWRAVRAEVE